MRAHYDHKPAAIEAVGNGSYLYRWNIKKVESTIEREGQEPETHVDWKCEEVVIWVRSADEAIKAVYNDVWGADAEAKLINDYNGYVLGVLGSEKLVAYYAFLAQRKALKRDIENAFASIDVPTIAQIIANKIDEIKAYDRSESVNGFYVGEEQLWISPIERVNFKNYCQSKIDTGSKAEDVITYSINGVAVTISLGDALRLLAQLEVYAGDAARRTVEHITAVSELVTPEAVEAYDYTTGYPEKIRISME